jgi:U3 small nucleolar RNA-associated protein 25
VPSYFDFLRLRNWFDAQEISFAAISEYTSDADVSRARSDFYHGRKQYLLITERFHFFRRYRLRGINHLIFYGVPDNPVFYPEFINMVMAPQSTDEASNTGEFNTMIMIIYGQYDALALERIVGTQRLQKMLIGDRDTFMFS